MDGELPAEALDEGEARLQVERFGLTSNNISYAALGEELGYWRVFPRPDGWGVIPAWGSARVVASRSAAAAEGARVFGLVPMASRFTVRPQSSRIGFADAAAHRADLAPVYNRYLPQDGEDDDLALVMRPLFGTSLVLDMVLAEAGFHGARSVVLTSASSKTCFGLAHLLRERQVETLGLTSAARRAWVEDLDLYDQVRAYGEAADLRAPGGAVLVDFAGDRALLRRLHETLGDALRRSILVGFTHLPSRPDEAPLAVPGAEFFFAPTEMARHGRELAQRYPAAWQEFAPLAGRAMRVRRLCGGDELLGAYRELLDGRSDPAVGYVVSL